MAKNQVEYVISALAVGEFSNDRLLLHDVFAKPGWRLFEARDRRRALHCLEQNPVHVVLTECDMPNWGWKRVLSDLRRLANPPQLIVTSRTADDYLWSEVLNLGGYDVLAQPFDRDEIERVIAAARRHFHAPAGRATQPAVSPAASVA